MKSTPIERAKAVKPATRACPPCKTSLRWSKVRHERRHLSGVIIAVEHAGHPQRGTDTVSTVPPMHAAYYSHVPVHVRHHGTSHNSSGVSYREPTAGAAWPILNYREYAYDGQTHQPFFCNSRTRSWSGGGRASIDRPRQTRRSSRIARRAHDQRHTKKGRARAGRSP